LANEGRFDGVFNVGDVMYDVALYYGSQANNTEAILNRYEVTRGQYVLATCHRAENTDNLSRLKNICLALADIAKELPVILPVHPRTRGYLMDSGMLQLLGAVRLIEPLSFLEMVALEQAARVIVTDSGGVQKEAYFYGVPCVTMRDETEWTETVDLGWNTLAGASHSAIYQAFLSAKVPDVGLSPYGDGHASERIVASLMGTL
jgi:UDP-GlcNAc3NAcA epimerase